MPRTPFVVLCGHAGEHLDRVAEALAAGGMPFMHADPAGEWSAEDAGPDSPQPSAMVLVEPDPGGWRIADAVQAPSVMVMFRQPDLSELADTLLRGVRSLVRGEDVGSDLAAVVALAAHGYFAMPTEHLDELVRWLGLPGERPVVPELTTRENDILGSIARGHTVRQTARTLGIAVKTVENTQARLFRKLGAHNRSGALTIAYRMGLVDPADGQGDDPVVTS